jgi:hypothetical protein
VPRETCRGGQEGRGGGRGAKTQARRRWTAASGGAPARSRRNPGNPGFAGYDYQIERLLPVQSAAALPPGLPPDCAGRSGARRCEAYVKSLILRGGAEKEGQGRGRAANRY